MQAYQCTPAFFTDSYFLNKFSSEVIADRAPVQPTARVICERHTISVVPVTRITMSHSSRSFHFYIIGFSREVYMKDPYPAQFCWGLCSCLEWLNLQLDLSHLCEFELKSYYLLSERLLVRLGGCFCVSLIRASHYDFPAVRSISH